MDQQESTKCSKVKLTPVSSYLCETGYDSCEGRYGQDCRCLYCCLVPVTIIYDLVSFFPRLCIK